MISPSPPRLIRFWSASSPSVSGMLRVENEDQRRTTYSEHFSVVAVYAGAFDGWYRGGVVTHVAGALKLKEPGEVHRNLRVHAPFTMQGATFTEEAVSAAADAAGIRGTPHFRGPALDADEPATKVAFAMHAALMRPDATELERSTLVAETLSAVLSASPPSMAMRRGAGATRAVRRARAFLHDAGAEKVTLDALADHAQLDKFHLVRAFRAEVGLPPYEYLTHVRVWRAKVLLERGARVAEAAHTVGFYDESQLHRHFRRIIGVAPGRFSRDYRAWPAAAPREARSRASQHRPSSAARTAAESRDERTHPH